MFRKFLTFNCERKIKLTAVAFSATAVFGTITYAQSVNDDLKPKKTESKTAVSKPKSTVKNVVKTPTKKTASPNRTMRKTNGARVNPARTVQTSSYSAETSDQIINRFMNFQQSASVTRGDWQRVLAQTAKVLQDNPNHSVAKAQSLIAQGQIAYNQRKYAMATIHFKSVLQILPESSLPHYGLGKTYLANGQVEAAERAFKQAIEQNENFALAYKGLGDALNARGEKKKAAKYFKKATEISVKEGNMPL